MTPLERAIKAMGSVGNLASAIGVAPSAPSMWKARKNVPAEYCPAIERETRTRGEVVTCEELRPDVAWDVLRAQAAEPQAVAAAVPRPIANEHAQASAPIAARQDQTVERLHEALGDPEHSNAKHTNSAPSRARAELRLKQRPGGKRVRAGF